MEHLALWINIVGVWILGIITYTYIVRVYQRVFQVPTENTLKINKKQYKLDVDKILNSKLTVGVKVNFILEVFREMEFLCNSIMYNNISDEFKKYWTDTELNNSHIEDIIDNEPPEDE